MIVVDTLRSDHLSCYGYARPTSPAICALAGDGVRFTRAYTVRTATTPAIASMFTGLYPHRHGVKDLYRLLPAVMTTVPERLKAAGWATGGFVSSFVMMRDFSGLDQGFDIYEDDVRTRELLRDNYQRDAAATVDRAIAWLGANGPHAFLFLHLIEPHGPYTPPSPYKERFALPAVGAEPAHVPEYQRLPDLRTVNEYVGRYDGEIAAADAQMARVMAALRAHDWYDRATILLLADHGESLGEEDHWFEHGRGVHDAEARVPLILKLAGPVSDAPAPGTALATAVSVLDVFPTLLAAADLPVPADTYGTDLALVAGSGERPGPPPVTWLERDGEVIVAAHAEGCTARWSLPDDPSDAVALFAQSQPPRWLDTGRTARVDAGGDGGALCAERAAVAITPLLADRFTFTLGVPVVYRADMRDLANRRRFIAERARAVPLSEHEHEALRQLGYAE
jgi:arylsulfatase A-like enzyme